MIVYLISFIIPPILMGQAYNRYNQNRKYKVHIFFSAFLLILIAGIRGIEIGTDIRAYQYNMFVHAGNSSSFEMFCSKVSEATNEYGYLWMLYITTKLTQNINAVFFVEEALVVVPVFYGIWYYKRIANPGIVTMAYCLLFYVESFNVIRQNIAMSFVFCSVLMFLDRKYKSSFFLFLTAFLFHKTTLISLIIFPLIVWIRKAKKKGLFISIVGVLVFAITLLYRQLFFFIASVIPIFPERYLSSSYISNGNFDIPIMSLAICFMSLVIMFFIVLYKNKPIFTRKNNKIKINVNGVRNWNIRSLFFNRSDFHYFIILMNVTTCSSFYLQSMSSVAARLIWFFQIFNVFSIGLFFKFVKEKEGKLFFLVLFFCLLFVNWCYYYVYIGNAEVYPYCFFWQK